MKAARCSPKLVPVTVGCVQGLLTGLEGGELVLVAAALLWSCQTVRLGRVVASRQPLQLATQQVLGLSCVSGDVYIMDMACSGLV